MTMKENITDQMETDMLRCQGMIITVELIFALRSQIVQASSNCVIFRKE